MTSPAIKNQGHIPSGAQVPDYLWNRVLCKDEEILHGIMCATMKTDSVKTKKTQELTDELIFSILRKHADVLKKLSVRKIGLFGSFVRGEQNY
jgi:hypothetical protein